jgi:phage head maturation protease
MTARVKEFDVDERTIVVVASSGKVDRHREIVRANGWDLKDYNNNPIVLTNHNANDVLRSTIGKTLWTKVIKGELIMKIYLGKTGAGAEAFDMISDLGIAAFSVGFNEVQSKQMFVSELEGMELESAKAVGLKKGDRINVITKANLFEVSLVSLPADQYALMKGNYEPTAVVRAGFSNTFKTKNLQETYKDIDFKDYMPATGGTLSVDYRSPEVPDPNILVLGTIKEHEEEGVVLDDIEEDTITTTPEELEAMIEARIEAMQPQEPMVEIDISEPMVEISLEDLEKSINDKLEEKYTIILDNTISEVNRKVKRLLGIVIE